MAHLQNVGGVLSKKGVIQCMFWKIRVVDERHHKKEGNKVGHQKIEGHFICMSDSSVKKAGGASQIIMV